MVIMDTWNLNVTKTMTQYKRRYCEKNMLLVQYQRLYILHKTTAAMALNKYMHSRNIYRTPPSFRKLSQFSEFSAISKVDVTGKITIDFKDPHALRVLTKCLLKSDFNLDVDIPENRLVPTLPLRLNYILWIEDLLSAIQRNNNIWGLDIGTGACTIYPLLAAVKNKWYMVGTETDTESLAKAEENVQNNGLQDLIKLINNTTKSIISHVFKCEDKQNFDFCMCNPPFYSTLQELYESRSPARLAPKNGFTGSPQELITVGGELEFCRKLITESKEYQDNIQIFTTMVGHKYTLNVLIEDLKSEGIKFTHTEFCQGRITRWGLAWTYKDYDLLNLVPPRDKPRKKKHSRSMYLLPELPNCNYNTEIALTKIKELLNSLHITYKLLNKRRNKISLDIVASTNTWSNQRRKRRLLKSIETAAKVPKFYPELEKYTTHNSVDSNKDKEGDEPIVNISNIQKISSVEDNHYDESLNNISNEPLVHAFLKLIKKENNILLEIEFLGGSAGKEGLHQIVQYIKNHWK